MGGSVQKLWTVDWTVDEFWSVEGLLQGLSNNNAWAYVAKPTRVLVLLVIALGAYKVWPYH